MLLFFLTPIPSPGAVAGVLEPQPVPPPAEDPFLVAMAGKLAAVERDVASLQRKIIERTVASTALASSGPSGAFKRL